MRWWSVDRDGGRGEVVVEGTEEGEVVECRQGRGGGVR